MPKRYAAYLGLSLFLLAFRLDAQSASFRVVVNGENPVESMTRQEVSQLFLKQVTRWKGGGKVEPIDQAKSSQVRKDFTAIIHGEDVEGIESYWMKRIFSGRGTPPSEAAGDGEVLDFVRARTGAIGYVAAGTPLGEGVRELRVE